GRCGSARVRPAVVSACSRLVGLATLSRSGMLGLVVGAVVLLYPYRHLLFSRLAVLPLALVGIPVAYALYRRALVVIPVPSAVYRRRHFFTVVLHSRLSHGTGASTHLDVFRFIPQILHKL